MFVPLSDAKLQQIPDIAKHFVLKILINPSEVAHLLDYEVRAVAVELAVKLFPDIFLAGAFVVNAVEVRPSVPVEDGDEVVVRLHRCNSFLFHDVMFLFKFSKIQSDLILNREPSEAEQDPVYSSCVG